MATGARGGIPPQGAAPQAPAIDPREAAQAEAQAGQAQPESNPVIEALQTIQEFAASQMEQGNPAGQAIIQALQGLGQAIAESQGAQAGEAPPQEGAEAPPQAAPQGPQRVSMEQGGNRGARQEKQVPVL